MLATEAKQSGKKCAIITNIYFKRIILHIEGELIGFDSSAKLGAKFITMDKRHTINPQHFDVKGNKFKISMNVLSANKEMPIETGSYILSIYDKTIKSKNKLNEMHHAYLSEDIPVVIDDDQNNPANLRIYKSASHLFYCISKIDLDTDEYYIDVTYNYPKPSQMFLAKMLSKGKKQIKQGMKAIFALKQYVFYKLYYFWSKHAKRKGDVIFFTSASRSEIGGNEEFIYNRMIERGLDKEYKFRFDFKSSINTRRNLLKKIKFTYYLATSDTIIIDDYYPEIYRVDYPKEVKVIQVWHACGAFKSLGLERMGKPGAPALNTRVHKCYTHVPVSSHHSAMHHAEAFGISEKKFYPVGIPRTDIFFDDNYKKEVIEKMYKEFPQAKKADKVYLYAPTFRGDNALNAYFPYDKLDLYKLGEFCKETNSIFIIKMHPFVASGMKIPEEYEDYLIDATSYREVNDILFIVDFMITDYSSIIYEFSLLRRPMLFFAFDQKMYEATRDFYEPYEEIVPGKIVKTFDALMEAIKNEDYDYDVLDQFVKKNFTYTDGKATDRVIDELIVTKK